MSRRSTKRARGLIAQGRSLAELKTGPRTVRRTRTHTQNVWLVEHGGKPVHIGGSWAGNVYIGRARIQGKVMRVAVKILDIPPSQEVVDAYNMVIRRLTRAGVRLPRMGMMQMPTARRPEGEWVQVSQLFGSTTQGSKIQNKTYLKGLSFHQMKETVVQLTKAGNAGFFPRADLVEPFNTPAKGVIPMDLDLYVGDVIREKGKVVDAHARTQRDFDIAERLYYLIEHMTKNPAERKALLELARNFASLDVNVYLYGFRY